MRRDAQSSRAGFAVVDHGAVAAAGGPEAEGWSTTGPGQGRSHRHLVRAPYGHPLADASGRDGLRVRRDLLATIARLASRRRLGPTAPRTAAPIAGCGPDRLEPSLRGQFVDRGEKGGAATGPNPTDRGRPGTKRHLITDRRGIPLGFLLTGANVHDSMPFEALIDAVPPIRGKRGRPRRRPDKLHADKAYDHRRCRNACRRRKIKPRIARRGLETSQKLGRHRWVIERTFAWFNKLRRLTIRYERRLDIHHAFTSIACSLMCLNALAGRF
jgi:transposase